MMGRLLALVLFFGTAIAAVGAEVAAPVQTRVEVWSHPEGAQVAVDGQSRGTAPLVLTDLEPGVHRLKLSAAGFAVSDSVFEARPGELVRCGAELEPERGLLLVTSEPSGADVVADGLSLGKTPCLVTTLGTAAEHEVLLRHAGCLDGRYGVRFDGRLPVVLAAKLVSDVVKLEIVTDPKGAAVTVNGIARGETPIVLTDVPSGRISVGIALSGYREEARELTLKAGASERLEVPLVGLPGTLALSSVPDGARFYVDGEFRGKGPLTIPSMKPGDYVVRAELEGYGTVERTVRVDNGSTPREEFRLDSRMGRIELRSVPEGAEVVFDGKVLGVTTKKDPDAEFSDVFSIENILDGEHLLVLRRDGYEDARRHPKIRSGKTAKAKVRMKRIFAPNVEVVTENGTFTGMLVSSSDEMVVIEVKLGITRGFMRSEIRNLKFIK